MKSGIICEKLRKTVDNRVILDDVSLKATRGSVVALLGPNGAGKTTTFCMLCGLIKPDSGKIFLDNLEITRLPMYKRARLGIGYLPQESSIFVGLTVEENISAVLEAKKIPLNNQRPLLEKLLNSLSLSEIRNSSAVSISGGERRKLEIARALATSPSFMLLDEPLAGIDPIAIDDMKKTIVALKNNGIGMIITDHNVRDTLPLVDYAYILFEGKVLIEGSPKEIINNKTAKEIYLGESFSLYNSFHEGKTRPTTAD
ncbi:MAG: LPS export ABC transporter ATP-binding protein [Holosporaceae bacterium]|jgi:lipopolysaccharide export system ATP-binding protein|nr:LPS export ABC transporter ATP-binding protein [Holosporaceae bacterium]